MNRRRCVIKRSDHQLLPTKTWIYEMGSSHCVAIVKVPVLADVESDFLAGVHPDSKVAVRADVYRQTGHQERPPSVRVCLEIYVLASGYLLGGSSVT